MYLSTQEHYEEALEAIIAYEEKHYPHLNIEDIDLSVLTYNCLKHNNITSIIILTRYTENQLLKMHKMGTKSLNEIKKIFTKYNLTFKPE